MTDGQFRWPGRMDVALTQDEDDWAPAGIGSSTLIYIDPTGNWTLTGIQAEAFSGAGNEIGRMLKIVNEHATNTVSLAGLDAGSAAANQFAWSGTVTIGQGESLEIFYDRAATIWRRDGIASGSGTPGGADTQIQYNNAGAFGGDSAMTFDAANDQATFTHARVAGVFNLTGDAAVTVSTTPQHDWAPSGLATAGILRVNPDTAAVSITGIAAPSSPFNDGRVLLIKNVGTGGFALNFINESASSTAANRLSLDGNFALQNGQGVTLVYDSVASRWSCFGMMGPTVHLHTSSVNGGALDTASLTSGTMATARLGSGTASAVTLLHGDQTYKPQSTFVVLGSNVVNNNATPDTMEDVTGLSFSVTSGETYWFRANIGYTAAATTTGSRWSCNGPTVTSLFYTVQYHSSAAGINGGGYTTYDQPAASSANSSLNDNRAVVEGVITPSASGTLIIRHASEVSGSAITALAGSYLEWRRIA